MAVRFCPGAPIFCPSGTDRIRAYPYRGGVPRGDAKIPLRGIFARKNRSLFLHTDILRQKSVPARDFYAPLNTPPRQGAHPGDTRHITYARISATPLNSKDQNLLEN